MQELRDAGYLPAAVRNYLALLGWGTQDDTTILSTEELIERFDIAGVGPLERDLRRAEAALAERPVHARDGPRLLYGGGGPSRRAGAGRPLRAACGIAQEKAQTLKEVWPLIGFLFEEPETDEKAWRKVMKDGALPLLTEALEALRQTDTFEPEELETSVGADPRRARGEAGKALSADPGCDHRDVGIPGHIRIACSIGKDRSLERIERAVERPLLRPPTETVS